MTDSASQSLVERLRRGEGCIESNLHKCRVMDAGSGCICALAADHIERQSRLIAEKDAEIERLRLYRERDLLRIQHFVECVEYSDSYGVPGSDFAACLICRGGGAPGVPMVHEDRCPVNGSLDRYQAWIDEQREFERESEENRRRALSAESSRDAAVEAEREACAQLCDQWIGTFQDRTPIHVSAQQWATDAVEDIAEAIRSRAQTAREDGAGK